MTPAEGIRKLGFRRWYERQLIESHAWFITAFLCLILALACAEDLGWRAGGWKPLLMLGLMAAASTLGWVALQRYRRLLVQAEYIAEQTTCPRCASSGRIQIVGAGTAAVVEPETGKRPAWMRVQCRRCAQQWVIE